MAAEWKSGTPEHNVRLGTPDSPGMPGATGPHSIDAASTCIVYNHVPGTPGTSGNPRTFGTPGWPGPPGTHRTPRTSDKPMN